MKLWIAAAAVALLGATWWHGHATGGDLAHGAAAVADAARLRQAFEQGREMGAARDAVITKYVDRVQVVEKAGQTIIKEVPVYVPEAADRACVVPAGFVRVHDSSAAGVPLSGDPGAADEAAPGVALSTVATTVSENYTACRANAEQLAALQQLLRSYLTRTKEVSDD